MLPPARSAIRVLAWLQQATNWDILLSARGRRPRIAVHIILEQEVAAFVSAGNSVEVENAEHDAAKIDRGQ